MATARPGDGAIGRRERRSEARIGSRRVWPMLAVLLAASCQRTPEPLRIATHVWPGFEPLYLAGELGYYGSPPPRLQEMLSGTAGIAAFRARSVDAAAMTLDEALLLVEDGVEARVVLVLDYSYGGDVVLARPGITGLAQLRGRRVGAEASALGAFVLSRALQSVGMRPSDVQVVPLAADMHEQAFLSGSVDAVATYDPFRTRLLGHGARVIYDSTQMPGEIVDVLIVHADVLRQRRPDVDRIVEGWYRALGHIAAHRADACERMAKREGISGAEFEASLSGLRLLDRAENRRLLEGPRPALLLAAERLAAVMRETGLLRGTVDAGQLLGPSFASGARPP